MVRFITLGIVGLVLIFADQLTKDLVVSHLELGESRRIIEGFFNVAYVQNRGAAFGFGNDGSFPVFLRQLLFLFLPVLFCGWIAYLYYKTIEGPLYLSVAYMLVLAGAIGNLIDRFRLGYVVDFLMFYWKEEANHFHVFNIADSCVTVAAFLLIFDFWQQARGKKKQDLLTESR